MTKLVQDLRFAARTLRRSPIFTGVALLTLALGIGANSAIFTLIDAVLLRPLPFPNPGRLVMIWEDTSMFGVKDSPVALGNYISWRAQSRTFEEMGALEENSFRLTGGDEAIQVPGSLVTSSLLTAIGVQPALGRLFREGEDRPGAPKTVILSDGLWRRRFGGDPAVIGKQAAINDDTYEIVGVMPAGFQFPDVGNQLWAPAGARYPLAEFSNRGRHNWMVVGRLRPDTSLDRANQEIRAIAQRAEHDFPESNKRVGAFVAPLREHFAGDSRAVMLVLAGAVGFVLLIACANISNLLLARASNRTREVAIRAAVGAGRAQIVRQLLTENLLLAAAGGVCGLLVATWSLGFLEKLIPRSMASMAALHVDSGVLAFTLGVSLLTGVLFGLIPAWQTMRVDLHQVLKQRGSRHGAGRGGRGIERGLVISEVALAFLLTLGAALMIQTFARLRGSDPGFRTKNILTLKTPLPDRKYQELAAKTAYYDNVLQRVTALPGVVSAAFALGVPLDLKGWVNGFGVEGPTLLREGQFSNANQRIVTWDYFKTLGIPLKEGRLLDRRDVAGAPYVLVINQALKRKLWGDGDALGRRLKFGPIWVSVVGVVGDVKQAGLDQAPKPEMYLSAYQVPDTAPVLAIRTQSDPSGLVAAVCREIRAVDPDVPITNVQTMEEILDREVFQRRVQTLLLSIFAAVAMLLAALGIYGVLAYLVAQRTQEIGVRMALGAQPADLLLTVGGEGVALSAAGIAIGAVAAFALTKVLSRLLFGITATDPAITFASVALLLLLVAALAAYIPARRAMRVDPILALREE